MSEFMRNIEGIRKGCCINDFPDDFDGFLHFSVIDYVLEDNYYCFDIAATERKKLFSRRNIRLSVEVNSLMQGMDIMQPNTTHLCNDGVSFFSCGRLSDNFLAASAELFGMDRFNWVLKEKNVIKSECISRMPLNFMEQTIAVKIYPAGIDDSAEGYCEAIIYIDIRGGSFDIFCAKEYRRNFLFALMK